MDNDIINVQYDNKIQESEYWKQYFRIIFEVLLEFIRVCQMYYLSFPSLRHSNHGEGGAEQV